MKMYSFFSACVFTLHTSKCLANCTDRWTKKVVLFRMYDILSSYEQRYKTFATLLRSTRCLLDAEQHC